MLLGIVILDLIDVLLSVEKIPIFFYSYRAIKIAYTKYRTPYHDFHEFMCFNLSLKNNKSKIEKRELEINRFQILFAWGRGRPQANKNWDVALGPHRRQGMVSVR